ncbi:MAG: glycerol-3-phosphate dehydrogenase [Oscillospiraceae bacterium]|nr:glycerol-3-phosphate dehydrogenase [Oscillospiraceae bacterium]
MNISVLGSGRWGGFIAWYLNKIGHNVLIWGRPNSSEIEELIKKRTNGLVSFKKDVIITDDIDLALNHSNVVIISISSQALRSFLSEHSNNAIIKKKTIVLCMKGLEFSTGKRLSEIVNEVILPNVKPSIWVGPGHVQDLTQGVPTCMVIDCDEEDVKVNLIKYFSSKLIKLYIGNDMIGNEIGAAAKNVIGIAAGMLDGINYSSLKGVLMTRGAREVSRVISACKGKEICAYGLAHLGDYQATLFSLHSNNRKFGEMFVKDEKFNKLCEGVKTAEALLKLGRNLNLDLPICKSVNDVINKKIEPEEALLKLFSTTQEYEFCKNKNPKFL